MDDVTVGSRWSILYRESESANPRERKFTVRSIGPGLGGSKGIAECSWDGVEEHPWFMAVADFDVSTVRPLVSAL